MFYNQRIYQNIFGLTSHNPFILKYFHEFFLVCIVYKPVEITIMTRERGGGKAQKQRIKIMEVGGVWWVVGGWWYERIAVTVRLRLLCFLLSSNLFWSRLSRP